jgi:hypothetical protein
MTSNKRLVVGASWMVSPDIKHNFLLSSSTVFMLSIQTASTGPSNTSHFLKVQSIQYNYQHAMDIKYLSIHKKMSGIMEPEGSSMISRSKLIDSIYSVFDLRPMRLTTSSIYDHKIIMINK